MSVGKGAAGLHIAVTIGKDLSAALVAKAAADLGVGVMPIEPNGLALGFGKIETSKIAEGVRRLSKTVSDADR